MKQSIERAKNNFLKREYKKALLDFSLVLKDEPYDLDAKIGVLLSDMAMEKEEEAIALFELYESSRQEGLGILDEMVERLLDSEGESLLYTQNTMENEVWEEEGISYKDFLNFVDDREDFQRALEDVMFSTRIVIQKREDFMQFVSLLIEHNYSSLALNYLENALSLYPHEVFFQESLQSLEGQ